MAKDLVGITSDARSSAKKCGLSVVDMACADLANRQPMLQNHSVLHENCMAHKEEAEHHDHFHMTHPDTNWRTCVAHAVKIGVGTDQYELIEI